MAKRKKSRAFALNQFVVYPAHGVGKVTGIENQEIAGTQLELYVISIESEKLTLRVPTKKALDIGLRELASTDKIEKALKTLKGKARVKRSMWSRRAQEYEQKINSGDIMMIAEVVRDLHRSDKQKEQSYSERQLFEQAISRFAREVAVVQDKAEEAVSQRIDGILSARKG